MDDVWKLLNELMPGAAETQDLDELLADLKEQTGSFRSLNSASLCLSEAGFSSVDLTGGGRQAPGQIVFPDASDRYEEVMELGQGTYGAVFRVRDRYLNRTVAQKRIRQRYVMHAPSLAQFIKEAQLLAQLQHPNIIPVYDIGAASDGTLWFTMLEVRGATFREFLRQLHEPELDPARRRALAYRGVSVLVQIARGVGFAHSHGITHRDLKPANAMLGEKGGVWVLDWGLSTLQGTRVVNEGLEWGGEAPDSLASSHSVTGTPGYMSPEQARVADPTAVDARSDVFALGAMLHRLCTGRVPFVGDTVEALLENTRSGQVALDTDGHWLSPDLIDLCRQSLSVDPSERPPDGNAFADALEQWLDGVSQRRRALERVARARACMARATACVADADAKSEQAAQLLSHIPTWAPAEEKREAWSLETEAEQSRRAAVLADLEAERDVLGALEIAPTLTEARALAIERHGSRHGRAEARLDWAGAAREQAMLERHLVELPADHPLRLQWEAYLKGDGAVSLVTEPPGATVRLMACVEEGRRLETVFERDLGPTPLQRVPLAHGSWILEVQHPDCETVRYPVCIRRQEHWDGVPPDGDEPEVIALPPKGALGEDGVLVPAGWFTAGGDPQAERGDEAFRVWCGAFVMQDRPVTNRQYLVFLNDLVNRGRVEEALQWVPRERASSAASEGAMCYGQTSDGHFVLKDDADGDPWLPEYPVVSLSLMAALHYAAWFAERTGQPWRLPSEYEWEKAARGCDGRWFPWGNGFDPSYAHIATSHIGRPLPATVDRYLSDSSPYGIHGLGGNVRDWCGDRWNPDATLVDGSRLVPDLCDIHTVFDRSDRQSNRGGVWGGLERDARSAARWRCSAFYRTAMVGLRLVRPVDPPSPRD